MTNLVDKAQKAVTVGGALASLVGLRLTANDATGRFDRVTIFGVLPLWNRAPDGQRTLFGIRLRK